MSVLIEGMEMPKTCYNCKFKENDEDFSYCSATFTVFDDGLPKMERPSWCPLIEVPPHGRLIDADALNLDYEVEMADHWKTAHEMANIVKYAPTIIEAENNFKGE